MSCLALLAQNACVKVIFSWNFRCFEKEVVILLITWSILYVIFSKCIGSWFWLFFFIFWFAIFFFVFLNFFYSHKMPVWKSFILEILGAPRKKQCFSSFLFAIASFAEHLVYSIFKIWSEMIVIFSILIWQYPFVKVIFSWNFRYSAKEEMVLLL